LYIRSMTEAFELLDPRNARAFLERFNSQARRKGEQHFRRGSVQALAPEQPGLVYSAEVRDGEVQDVELEYDPVHGWSGVCSCPAQDACEHVFAAMRALLAEHSAAAVRSLSAGVPSAAAWAKSANATDEEAGGLARRLMATLRRPLDPKETRFIRKIQAVYKRCQKNRHITHWDFEEMGLRLGGYGWDALQIWPAFPVNEHEFWLYVAHAAQEHHVTIPEFMRSVTDLNGVQQILDRWRRTREIEKWKEKLNNYRCSPHHPVIKSETDLRLVIGEEAALLEWQRPGQPAFQTLKHSQSNQLANDHRDGRVHFTHEAELLWHLFSRQVYYGNATSLRYHDPEATGFFRRILRVRLLDSRIVTRRGQPLARPSEPLRWELTPAATQQDDYLLRLVQADGTLSPTVLCALPGSPTLYLTADALFTGPNPQEHVLDPASENRIPAPAIERVPGVTFLQSLGVELPPRIRSRVRTLPYQVSIHCRLQPIYLGADAEECVVQAVAQASDGRQQTWMGYEWLSAKAPGSAGVSPATDHGSTSAITLYDDSVLSEIPQLLGPLNLKPSSSGRGVSVRVSKKFPDLFATWLKTIPPHITVELAGDLASFTSPDVAGRVKLDVSEAEIDWFDLRVVLDVSDTTLTPDEIKLLLNAKGGYVRLAGKGWRRLQYDLTEDESERLARLGLSPRELSAEPQRLHALQLADDAAKKFLPAQQVEQIQRRAGELKARVAPDLPAGVTAQLRPYQLEGFHFLAYLSANRFGGILADDMGLGKTLQALAWLLWLREQPINSQPSTFSPQPALVVCPKSVMDNWHAEAVRFTPGLRVKLWPASELSGFSEQLSSADLHVLNYSQLRLLGESLVPVRWQAVILDEGQYIKNPSSQTAQIARALRAEHRLILSGTPIENRLLDLWSLMAFTMPGVLSSRAQFARLYDAKGDPFARRRLSSRVRPFLLRRTKAQVAKDLPDRIE